jgi:hypothetical protein
MVPLIAFICVLESVRKNSGFPTEKLTFDLRFFRKFFILQQCLDPIPNLNFFSDSDLDPAQIFGFFRIL